MKLSVLIPAYNEEQNIGKCLAEIQSVLRKEHIPYEIIVVNDNSTDGTAEIVLEKIKTDSAIHLENRTLPSGFGRAIRSGLSVVQGDVVIIYMADQSDDPNNLVDYYRKIEEGYDCVFGSRFIQGSHVENYPHFKRFVNRIVNTVMKYMFWTRFNDLTNAFKAYRTEVIEDCGPYHASHFNITLEMSLGALIRKYNIAEIPINWYGRTWGCSNLHLREMGRKYLSTLLMMFFQRVLIADDLLAERLVSNTQSRKSRSNLTQRIEALESQVDHLRHQLNRDLEEDSVRTDHS
ncbi:MAG: cell wall biosynthesis glycosyltransferase [Gimesia sp.]|mgnify:FL=1|jgi:dolichol-phosphate mannosyltransferase|uniref:Cell wall biosynthesis glycosyltransferase n=1 Tax=Gimesia maris TaxID=122 RepID=A0A3D3R8T4_9PLAN|nr:cell wall biosynthesis glycosyltransferase [Gimesia sp.]HCO24427.1 cell wall biosynthesis glycosyltransferase [Gimesia maris]|tara:strand:+ start:3037 stop:3909 length:873 start_codon:yes stop_codon:yes gene_type:complete